MQNALRKLIQTVKRRLIDPLTPKEMELRRLRGVSRHEPGSTTLLGTSVTFLDSASLLAQIDEIWNRQIYLLGIPSPQRILDCGANIGVSTLFFASNYPNAKITSFEPDPNVFEVLKANCKAWNTKNAELVQAAVWTKSSVMEFHKEGADSGGLRGTSFSEGRALIQVPTVRLRDYLDTPIDLLKLDVEGAETDLLVDVSDRLHNVQFIFVEYHSFADRPQHLDVVLRILKSSGFRVHIDAGLVSSNPFVKRSTYNGMDQFLNIFGFRA